MPVVTARWRIVAVGGGCALLLVAVVAAAVGHAARGTPVAGGRIVGPPSAIGLRSEAPDATTSALAPLVPKSLSPTTTIATSATGSANASGHHPPISPSAAPAQRGTVSVTTTSTSVTVPLLPTMTTVPGLPAPTTSPSTVFNPDPNATQDVDGTWRVVDNGISISLQISPPAPRAGDDVHFVITASTQALGCCLITLYPGNGSMVPPASGQFPCPGTIPSIFTESADHVYTVAGSYIVEVQPSNLGFCYGVPGAAENARMFVPLTVASAS